MLFHFIRLHWRVILAVVAAAVVLWFCLPARLRTTLSDGWKRFGHFIGNVNARIILTVLYSTVLALFGLPVRLFSDALHSKKRPEKWFDHPPIPNTLEEARRQG